MPKFTITLKNVGSNSIGKSYLLTNLSKQLLKFSILMVINLCNQPCNIQNKIFDFCKSVIHSLLKFQISYISEVAQNK